MDAASDEAATELPPGYSRITDAIREIMELDEETYSNLLRQGAIVAPGHVLRFASDERESWDYFIAMEREMFAVISPLTKSG